MLKLGAWVQIDDETSIEYHTCVDQEVEFYIGGADGLNVIATKEGLEKLVGVAKAALCALEPPGALEPLGALEPPATVGDLYRPGD